MYRFPDGLFAAMFAAPSSVLSPAIHAVLAYVGGAPVATAQVFMHGEAAYVGWVAVVRNAARRGLGWLITETVVNERLARGAKAAVLLASPPGAPLYRKMGFVDVGWLRNACAARCRLNACRLPTSALRKSTSLAWMPARILTGRDAASAR